MFKFRFTLIAILGSFVAVAFTQESAPAKAEDGSTGKVAPIVTAAAEVNVTPAPKPAARMRKVQSRVLQECLAQLPMPKTP